MASEGQSRLVRDDDTDVMDGACADPPAAPHPHPTLRQMYN